MPLPEGDRVGLAFTGHQHEAQHLHEPTAVHRQSQLSGRTPETTSELPTSYSLSDITSQSSRARLRDSQRSVSDPGPLGHGSVGNSVEKSARSSSQPARPRTEAAQPEAAEKLSRTLLVKEPRPAIAQGTHGCHGCRRTFVTHITPALAWLAGEHSVVKDCYHPVSVSRTVRPLERGYWSVNTTTWTHEVQHKFWSFLDNQVGSGDAGWGVWCLREPDQSGSSLLGKRQDGLGLVKVFCWGEIAKHIYLMLYVASNSRVRKIGLQWVHAEEQVVVQMRSSET
ncbi:hypothetical protein LTR75_003795 [Friedmanniomyces endolithicus]|nr:hypothetical protein LTR75_003795 [Friedmanniomyces endolithicus]